MHFVSQTHGKPARQSRAEEFFLHSFFCWAVSALDHNAGGLVPRFFFFFLTIGAARSAIPLTVLFTAALLSEELCRAGDEPSLEIKVTVTKSKNRNHFLPAGRDTELA